MKLSQFEKNYLPERFYLIRIKRTTDMYPNEIVKRGKEVLEAIEDYPREIGRRYSTKITLMSDLYEDHRRHLKL